MNKIFNCVMDLKKATPSQIKKYLDYQAQKEVESQCKNQNIILSPQEKKTRIKEKTISDRAIKESLKKLTNQRKLDNDNGTYSIHDAVKSDIRNFAPQFGGSALNNLMDLFYPTINTLEENLEQMIQIFGIYIIYCFIEAARPIERHGKDDNIKNNRDKDKLASTWITDVFNPLGMYNYFLSIIENQPTDNEVKRILEKNVKNIGKDEFIIVNDRGQQVKGFPPSAANLFQNRFYYITSKQARYDEVSKPLYELDKEKITKLTRILKENYSIFYEGLLETRVGLLGEPKRRSIQSQRNKEPHYFDPNEDQ